ncbi:hypothetical protein WR25_17655 isoform D [Diploscapter pachys]|uniref:J domain-containing protein n=1 Tax=Diploscapter pachys TaxID=2018661 RepID=A0A2A2KWD0_9BILA|nr:hypothetical protein WR25_17655 isoform C [Diploscapter pachys]PAV78255.1 hypothetical protein WR25_17655 isoform D [Diploscapter pachys]
MAQFCANNRDVVCYLVTKHSWKGKYKRIFSIGTLAISTYNPQTLEITNQWTYEDFLGIKPSPKNAQGDSRQDEYAITIRSKGKRDTMRFSSDFTVDILTDCLQYSSKFADKNQDLFSVNAFKHSWSERRIPVVLRTGPASLQQVDQTGVVVKSYQYRQIRSIEKVSDCPGGFVLDIGEHRRRHMFASSNADDLIKEMRRLAAENIGILLPIAKETLSIDDFMRTRLGLCSRDELLTSYVEFKVQKITPKNEQDPVRRILCLSESLLIERDPATYAVICATPLKHIVCLVRSEKDPQQFIIEYESGDFRTYAAAERDLILASLLDGTRASGNQQIFVTSHRFDRSLRLLPHSTLLDEDSESQCMRHIIAPPPGLRRSDLIRRFNANIPYSGLTYSKSHEGIFSENKGKVILNALESVLNESYNKEDDPHYIHKHEAQLQCLRRLFASKSGFQAFTESGSIREKLGLLVIRVLAWKNEALDHATVEALSALMHPMHNEYELRTEQLNKQSLLSSEKFVEHLLDLVVHHVNRGSGWLVIASMLDFLTYAVCAPYSETTSGDIFDSILKMVAARGRSFYRLFQSPSMTIVKGAGMVMRAIIEEADVETSKSMQTLSLTEGAFLTHLHMALLAQGKDLRVLTNKQLSGHLIGLWLVDNQPANDLMTRCLPRGLIDFLDSDAPVPVKETDLLLPRNNLEAATNEMNQRNVVKEKVEQLMVLAESNLERFIQHWDLEQRLNFLPKRQIDEKKEPRPVVLRKRRQRVRNNVNWKLFAYEFQRDHAKADLMWNEKTREEFRHAIESELRALISEKEQSPSDMPISWNHTEFQVRYPSLQEEVKIGDYYLRLLLQETDESATPIHNPLEFFNNVYHRFLLSSKPEMRCLCLRAMAVTYGRHHMTIGSFLDAKYFVQMLQKCTHPMERDHLVVLLSKLVLNKENVRDLVVADVLPHLVDLAVLAHLHVQRATIQNQSNVIEASAEQSNVGGAAEWYYMDKPDKEKAEQRIGPLSFAQMKELFEKEEVNVKTKVWAAGFDKWHNLGNVHQFRWTVCATLESAEFDNLKTTVMNFSELCVVCLDTLIQMCAFFPSRDEYGSVVRPMPQVKRCLCEPVLLYQIVQLLLTYDPPIVQRVATLLYEVMQDNFYLPQLYLSGVFFFILMYNGSNVLPIARFLHYTHLKQAFRSALPQLEGGSHSVLAPLLPEAATFYLEQYGPEKYAEVFLGEFDNPEIIWNTNMRRHLIERIALHISDFSHRLTSNVKALYQFCPIPLIDYPELKDELFCHVYYLRHLCNKQRFPDWPIRDPIPFLRSCLAAWYEELEKRPPAMSVEQACKELDLDMNDEGWKDPATVRRSYYRLAAKYHPDKNPEGRSKFEAINTAYELLASQNVKAAAGTDTQRIILCLQAQSIIYSRHSQELSEYKYAGYGQLIKTIALEAQDNNLFQKGGGQLLSAAIELANYTLISSPLNAEQLRREMGLEALQSAFDRVVPMVTLSSQPDDMPVVVCEHICNCWATAAGFEQCRQRIAEMPTIFGNLCRLLQFPELARLSAAAATCICALSIDTLLQTQLFQSGVLWQLVPNLFHYDYTLDEGGVQHNEESNKQSLANVLARNSCEALACLAGFREDKPANDGVQNSLRALLTPFVCRCIRTESNDAVLKTLNSNAETPYLIWDNATRAEVLEFVERHRTSNEQTSELFGAEFNLSIHAKELIVGDIFVRIYNEQPTFPLLEPKKVAVDLLDFVEKYVTELTGQKKSNGLQNGNLIEIDWGSNANKMSTDEKVLMCLTALANVINSNPGIEILLIGRFPPLISYLKARSYPKIQIAALKVLSLAAANRECVSDLSNVHVCTMLFTLMHEKKNVASLVLSTLIALSSNGQIVKEMLEYGGLMYILSILCTSLGDQGERLQSAELLAKLQADKLTGPRWTRFIIKFLPPIFADDLRNSPSHAITMFDSVTENPELIWNDATRSKVKGVVDKATEDLYKQQVNNPEYKVLELMRKPNSHLPLVTNAFVELLRSHPDVANQLPSQGYLPQFCQAMTGKDPQASRAAILILQQLAENEVGNFICRYFGS